MRKRTRNNANPIERLRLAIDCLPVATREAMLAGVRDNARIIGGAYVDGKGGVCPMLAAHRGGGRTDFLAFAKSWDRFTRASGTAQAATEREVRILVSQLEASLEETTGTELDQAIREHRELRRRRLARRPRLPLAADPRGVIVARRLRPPQPLRRGDRLRALTAPPLGPRLARAATPAPYSASPGRTNIISGTMHAGETFSR